MPLLRRGPGVCRPTPAPDAVYAWGRPPGTAPCRPRTCYLPPIPPPTPPLTMRHRSLETSRNHPAGHSPPPHLLPLVASARHALSVATLAAPLVAGAPRPTHPLLSRTSANPTPQPAVDVAAATSCAPANARTRLSPLTPPRPRERTNPLARRYRLPTSLFLVGTSWRRGFHAAKKRNRKFGQRKCPRD